jgi:acyl-CoA hydrolase
MKRFSGASGIVEASEWIFSVLGPELRIATPLGLGKPNLLLNAVYSRVVATPARKLTLFTALSLVPPSPKGDLARRFFAPFADRHWGKNYPKLRYAEDGYADRIPPNVKIHEFYFQAGAALGSKKLQQNYISLNYTHVAEAVAAMDVEMILQLVAKRVGADGRESFSLSSNPDLTLDLVELCRKLGKPMRIVGVVHPDLPFLGGDAEVSADFFAAIVESPAMRYELFALPRTAIDAVDHRIGFFASLLIKDGGTLQIGIGSLSDAVVASLVRRQSENALFNEVATELGDFGPAAPLVERGIFGKGLYGLSEMVTDGFMHLRRAGILKREVHDEKKGDRTFLHGAFFLGSKLFYEWLRTLPPEEARGVRMTRVSKVNDLYDPNELLLRRQRAHPRFLNTCLQVSLFGGAASETLEDGRVVSGVGGQYNFVAMAHELPDSRSILMLRSVREKGGKRISNIVWSQGLATIPRHLRDVVVTEYGIADLRGQDDETCIRRMLAVADAEFQPALMERAKRAGKLSADYVLPPAIRANTPKAIRVFVERWKARGLFAEYPFGSDFTDGERRLVKALGHLQKLSELPKIRRTISLLAFALNGGGAEGRSERDYPEELARMGLEAPRGLGERLTARALRAALRGGTA